MIYLISRVFLTWTFLNFLAHCDLFTFFYNFFVGVWATNGVKVQRSSAFLPSVVLFPDFCMANHQCNPKAMYVPYFSERSFKIDARAQTDIKAGQEITVR